MCVCSSRFSVTTLDAKENSGLDVLMRLTYSYFKRVKNEADAVVSQS